jgi:hypothetical protein
MKLNKVIHCILFGLIVTAFFTACTNEEKPITTIKADEPIKAENPFPFLQKHRNKTRF